MLFSTSGWSLKIFILIHMNSRCHPLRKAKGQCPRHPPALRRPFSNLEQFVRNLVENV